MAGRRSPVVLLVLALLLLACSPLAALATPPPEPRAAPREGVRATATPRPRAGRTAGQALDVIDTFAISVEIGGKPASVRFLGIGLPDLRGDSAYLAELRASAQKASLELVVGKPIEMESEGISADANGRLLRYVWVGDTMVNAELVRLGLAHVRDLPDSARYAQLLRTSEAEAREHRRGLWGDQPTPTPVPTMRPMVVPSASSSSGPTRLTGPDPTLGGLGGPVRAPTPRVTPAQRLDQPAPGIAIATASPRVTPAAPLVSCGTTLAARMPPIFGCQVKGNLTEIGRKVFHVPDNIYYQMVVISPHRGERWFRNEGEALVAEWRAASNYDVLLAARQASDPRRAGSLIPTPTVARDEAAIADDAGLSLAELALVTYITYARGGDTRFDDECANPDPRTASALCQLELEARK